MRTGMTNPSVRIAETMGILAQGKKTWERKREWNVPRITSNVEKWRPGVESNEKQSGINVYRDKETKNDEWTTKPLKQKGDVDQFTAVMSVRGKHEEVTSVSALQTSRV